MNCGIISVIFTLIKISMNLNTAIPAEEEINEGIRKIYKMNISESDPKNIQR